MTFATLSTTPSDVKEILSLPVTGIDSRGRGRALVRAETEEADAPAGRHVAVSWALPGDVVDVRITRRRGGLLQSTVTAVKQTRIPRRAPFCSHFSECGGCTIQDLAYEDQLVLKEQIVLAAFAEQGIELPVKPRPILPAPRETLYRNKLEYSFGAQRWLTDEEIASGSLITDRRALGFHAPGRFDRVIQLTECSLQDEPSNAIRNALDAFARENGLTYYDARAHTGLLRLLIIRTSLTGETMVTVMFGEDDDAYVQKTMEFLQSAFPEIISLNYVVNTSANDSIFAHEVRTFAGTPYIAERCGTLSLRIRPKAFYQTNPEQAERLYELVKERAEIRESDLVFDLFSGIGSIGMYLSPHVRDVVCVESVPDAVASARENVGINGISNLTVIEGLVEQVLGEAIRVHGVPRVMVIDPPRAGMHPSVLPVLKQDGAEKIVYVSCNPATQAKDIRELQETYSIADIQPVDMFPQTRHVESIVVLNRR